MKVRRRRRVIMLVMAVAVAALGLSWAFPPSGQPPRPAVVWLREGEPAVYLHPDGVALENASVNLVHGKSLEVLFTDDRPLWEQPLLWVGYRMGDKTHAVIDNDATGMSRGRFSEFRRR
jgi:hypothetical protein